MVAHIQKYHDMHIRPNITRNEWKRLREFKARENLIKLPADKGTAVVIENEQGYVTKEQRQINDMDVEPCDRSEKAILRHVRSRIIEEFKNMGLTEKQYKWYLVTAAEIANMYLPIKPHKPHDNFPGRPVITKPVIQHTNYAKSSKESFMPLLSKRNHI